MNAQEMRTKIAKSQEDIRVLKAFHDQYSKDSGVCDWCQVRVPVEQLIPFPRTINDETGMVDEEDLLCDECIALVRQRQQETSEGKEMNK